MNRRSWQTLAGQRLPSLVMGAIAFALVLVITASPGPGLDPDALQYIGAAESVAAHAEYRVPKAKWDSADSTEALAHFPPGYPTVLAIPVRLGLSPTQGARVVQATAAFITITTLVLLVSAAASPIAGILLAAALCAMTAMHEVHVSVLSEPLYLACLALTLAAMVKSPDKPWRSGLPAAVGVMTRYAGASLVGATAIWQLMQRQSPWPERVRRAMLALIPALVLQGVWVIRTRIAAGPREIRKFALYGDLGRTFAQGATTLSAWLIPDSASNRDPIEHRGTLAVAAGLSLVMVVSIGVWRVRRAASAAQQREGSFVGTSALQRDDARELMAWRLLTAATLLLVCYCGIVFMSRLVADPGIPFDERILSPALLLLMTITAVGLARWWVGSRLMIARVAVSFALLAWWIASATATLTEARYALQWGSDFAGRQWRESELLAWTRAHGKGSPLYTNWPAVVYFYLHRPSHELPLSVDSDSATLNAFADTVRVRGGHVLLFDVQTGEFADNDELAALPKLRMLAHLHDGVLLRAAGP